MDISFVTTKTDKEAKSLLTELGLPLKKIKIRESMKAREVKRENGSKYAEKEKLC
jgi:hypothetical protein